MKQLQNTVKRLNSLIAARELPRVGEKVAKEASRAKDKKNKKKKTRK